MSVDNFLLSTSATDLNYPNIRPSLDLNFARTKTLDPRITFTRSSGGSYVGADGLIKYAGVNEPRFDHSPTTGESLGLLIEEARTNLRTNSSTRFFPVVGTWTSTGTSTDIAAPDGTNTTYKVVSAGGGQSSIDIGYLEVSLTSGVTYTVSAYYYATHSTTTGRTVGISINGNATASSRTGGFILPQNQWVRRSLTFTASVTSSVGQLRMVDNDISGFNTTSGATLYLWGAQIEAGDFPTSYIPTTTAAATRSADVASITGTNFSSWYRQDGGTFCFLGFRPASSSQLMGILGVGANTLNTTDYIATRTGGRVRLDIARNSVLFVDSLGVSTTASPVSGAFGLSGTAICSFFVNGNATSAASISTGQLPTGSQLVIGRGANGGFLPATGTITRITYWPKRLPNAQLQALTR